MAYVITAACVDHKHAECVRVCPNDAIHSEPADRMSYIEPAACIDCRACVDSCPEGAIVGPPDPAFAAAGTWAAINARWYKDRDAARAQVDALRAKTR